MQSFGVGYHHLDVFLVLVVCCGGGCYTLVVFFILSLLSAQFRNLHSFVTYDIFHRPDEAMFVMMKACLHLEIFLFQDL